MNLNQLTIHELHKLMHKGQITSIELIKSVFDRIDQVESHIHSYITLLQDQAMKEAKIADKRIKDKQSTLLTGIPIAIKDIICTKNILTTCGSKMLHNFIPPYDATVVQKLKNAGAILIGKSNMDEFAMGSSTETSYFGLTRNPWDLERVPGGSSGGSAAAVAADECIVALGSDTGGSVRQPASLCGVVGMKPTYGLISRFGLIAFASSLDQIGTFCKDVKDTAILLQMIAGYDQQDSTSVDINIPIYKNFINKSIKGWKIGIPQEYFINEVDTEVISAVKEVINVLKELGAIIKYISLPHTQYCLAVYHVIAPAEASSNLARYDGIKYGYTISKTNNLLDMYKENRSQGFGTEVKRRIMIGTYVLSSGYYDAYYKKASQVRFLIKKDFLEAFKQCDIIISPTTLSAAFKIGEKLGNPIKMYYSDLFTIASNLAGIPAISVPCGYTKSGLPIGVQFQAKHFEESKLIQIASIYENNINYIKRRPNL